MSKNKGKDEGRSAAGGKREEELLNNLTGISRSEASEGGGNGGGAINQQSCSASYVSSVLLASRGNKQQLRLLSLATLTERCHVIIGAASGLWNERGGGATMLSCSVIYFYFFYSDLHFEWEPVATPVGARVRASFVSLAKDNFEGGY